MRRKKRSLWLWRSILAIQDRVKVGMMDSTHEQRASARKVPQKVSVVIVVHEGQGGGVVQYLDLARSRSRLSVEGVARE